MASGTKTVKFGNAVLEITDPGNIQPVSADLPTECRVYNGIACLSFAHLITDGDNAKPEARISARIRLTLAGAQDLRNMLDGLLQQEMPGKEKAN
jgi:hypothetical protein